MVESLDAVPWKERQWGHAIARNIINTKQQVIGLNFEKRRVISNSIDRIWASDLAEMQKLSK